MVGGLNLLLYIVSLSCIYICKYLKWIRKIFKLVIMKIVKYIPHTTNYNCHIWLIFHFIFLENCIRFRFNTIGKRKTLLSSLLGARTNRHVSIINIPSGPLRLNLSLSNNTNLGIFMHKNMYSNCILPSCVMKCVKNDLKSRINSFF